MINIGLALVAAVVIAVISANSAAAAETGTKVVVRCYVDQDVTVAGRLIEGRTYVDAKELGRCLPAGETFSPDDGRNVNAIGEGGKLWLPLRAAAAYFGSVVEWDDGAKAAAVYAIDRHYVLESYSIDLDRDGRLDLIRIVANRYEGNSKYFSAPVFLYYHMTADGTHRKLKLDVPPIDLTKGNVKLRTAHLDEDGAAEILYSIDYPQPEYVSRWPHLLHMKDGKLIDMDITKQYRLDVAEWEIESASGVDKLILHERDWIYGDPVTKAYRLSGSGELVKSE